jgi:hypothetical protein
MLELPQIHIPRLTDLLSGPLSCLHGPQRLAFDQLFQEIDSTLKENTCAIQLSIGNIVRAPYHLAGKCRPLLEDLVHVQRITGHGSVGEQSLTNEGCSQDVNIPAGHGRLPCAHKKNISVEHLTNLYNLLSYVAGHVQQQNSVPSPVASSQRQVPRGGSAHSSPTGPS